MVARPELAPPVDAAEVAATVDAVAACQRSDGSFPWCDGHVDPWNHVEAAMAMTVGDRLREAERAFRWLARRQRPDGSWYASYRDGRPVDLGVDANFCAYIAVGLHHHALATGSERLLAELWPVVEGGVGVAVALQAPSGEIRWGRDPQGVPHDRALLTGSACVHLSLRSAVAAAGILGLRRPQWEEAADRLAVAVAAARPDRFLDKSEYSMDWYYPVLGGALTGTAARVRLAEGWDTFVVEGLGARCIAGHPWVTAAETCELVLALDATGRHDLACEVYGWARSMRDPQTGGYWTGVVLPECCPWPAEQPAWTGAATVLAADALLGLTGASGLFRAVHDSAGEVLDSEEGLAG